MSGPSPSSAHDDVGAYLLGALAAGEARAFERHLEGCAACREEVARLRPAVEMLPRSADPVSPSPALKRELLARVREESSTAADSQPARARRWSLGALVPRPRVSTAWVSAAVLVLSGVAGGYGLSQLSGDDGGAERRVLSAEVDRNALPDASASLVVPPEGGPAELRVKGMKVPPPGQVSEIWLRRPGGVEPAGVFTVTRDGEGRATVDGEIGGSDQVMVTQERAGGVRSPTGAPMLSVRL